MICDPTVMPPGTLEEWAERWVPGAGPVQMQRHGAGLVNESHRVERAGQSYSLRVAGPGAADLELDRDWECAVFRQAATAGFAPRLAVCVPAEGILVADWVSGRSWDQDEVACEANMEAMCRLLRGVHALPIPRPARIMSPRNWIDHYVSMAARRGIELSSRATGLFGDAQSRLEALEDAARAPAVLCHSDLHRLNVVIPTGPAQPLLLDWEYAHVAEAFWDVAGWISNNDWTEDAGGEFLRRYVRRAPTAAEVSRLRLLRWLYEYVCLLWGEIHVSRPAG